MFGLFITSQCIYAQNYEKVYFTRNDTVNYYFKIVPKTTIKGLVVILPGIRGNSDWALKASKIPYIAADSGLVTILLQHEIWLGWLREDIVKFLNQAISEVIVKYNIPKNKCVIGGFSSGGTMALSYTELANYDSAQTIIKPKGVFGLDAPVDLIEIYNNFHAEAQGMECNGKRIEISEQTRNIDSKMTKYLGTPLDNYNNYIDHSPFIFGERYKNGGRAIYLKNVSLRLYSGIEYNSLQNKCDCGFYLDTSPFLISFLRSKGNKDATFKSQYDKDYNPDGGEYWRGKHEWWGFDSKECVEWILKTINKK